MEYYLSEVLHMGTDKIQANDVVVFDTQAFENLAFDGEQVGKDMEARAKELGVELSTFDNYPDRVHFGVK